jgi:hypothetical protein
VRVNNFEHLFFNRKLLLLLCYDSAGYHTKP